MRKTVMIPMRDGVQLATDLYFPVGNDSPRAVILTRTPYDKSSFATEDDPTSERARLLDSGFVFAVQDLRGTFESEGECKVSCNERQDGYDTVNWLASQHWSNGRVGTIGCSHRGEVQYQLAAERPPGLKCMVAQAGASVLSGESSRSYLRMGGTVNLGIASWYRRWQSTVRPHFPIGTSGDDIRIAARHYTLHAQMQEMRYPADFWHLPIIDLLDHVGSPPTEWRDLVSHSPADSWWQERGHVTRQDRFDVPILHVNSWFDFGVHETLLLANLIRSSALTDLARHNQFVVISPSTHCGSETWRQGTRIGEVDLNGTPLDLWQIYLSWFHFWLDKDRAGSCDVFPQLAPITYYSLLDDRWKTSLHWPPEGTKEQRLFLASSTNATGMSGGGVLIDSPQRDSGSDTFQYDPMNPVPTIGGVMWSPGTPPAIPIGPTDQTAVQRRDDVLVYTSREIAETQEFAGPVTAELYVRSSARDTDFTTKLTVVCPDGKAIWITEGILRLRYWDGLEKAALVPPGETVKLTIDMKSTAFVLVAGMKLRLEVSSSNFPRFERNLNTGGNNFDETDGVIAVNEVLHGSAFPSCVILSMRTQ